jgi:hypothetical protein
MAPLDVKIPAWKHSWCTWRSRSRTWLRRQAAHTPAPTARARCPDVKLSGEAAAPGEPPPAELWARGDCDQGRALEPPVFLSALPLGRDFHLNEAVVFERLG